MTEGSGQLVWDRGAADKSAVYRCCRQRRLGWRTGREQERAKTTTTDVHPEETMSSPREVERTDSHGNKVYFGDIGDMLLPPFPTIQDFRQHARDIKDMEMSADDVIIVGYPKTGSHWLSSVIHMLRVGSAESYYDPDRGGFLDGTPSTAHTTDRPRLFYTHLKLHHLPTQVQEKHVKLVYLERNPKDTWVSLYHIYIELGGRMAYGGTWDHFFDTMLSTGFFYGNWFDYVLDWERDIEKGRASGLSIYVNSYDELKKNPVSQIEKLDQFLGCNRERELYVQIAQACQFSTMKNAVTAGWKDDDSGRENPALFYRKGELGDWKNWFTVAQNERFDREYGRRMQGSKLRYIYN